MLDSAEDIFKIFTCYKPVLSGPSISVLEMVAVDSIIRRIEKVVGFTWLCIYGAEGQEGVDALLFSFIRGFCVLS